MTLDQINVLIGTAMSLCILSPIVALMLAGWTQSLRHRHRSPAPPFSDALKPLVRDTSPASTLVRDRLS